MASEFYGFFDSNGGDVRQYQADQMAAMFRLLGTDGVKEFGTNLQVIPDGGNMSIRVLSGTAMIRGYMYELNADDGSGPKKLTHAAANSNPRIDRVIVRLNLATETRIMQLAILTGAPSASPVEPALTRNSTTGIYEISLAKVLIPGASTAVTAGNITDERADDALCGAITPAILRLSLIKNNHVHDLATTLLAGMMSAADKTKLDDDIDQPVKQTSAPSFAGGTFNGAVDMTGHPIINGTFE